MLVLNNIEVVYSDVIQVLRGISLEVPDGKIIALLGANGAGKTTTLRAISGLLATQEGEITRGKINFRNGLHIKALCQSLHGHSERNQARSGRCAS